MNRQIISNANTVYIYGLPKSTQKHYHEFLVYSYIAVYIRKSCLQIDLSVYTSRIPLCHHVAPK